MIFFFVLFLILMLCLSAFSSASETALFSLSPLTIRSYRSNTDPKRKLVAKLLDSPRDLLVTLLIFNIIANLLIQNTVSSLFGDFPLWILKVGVPLVLVLIFGEILPKSLAISNNEKIAAFVAPWINLLIRGVAPIRGPLTKATNWISRFIFFFFSKEKQISGDELHHLLKTSEKNGVLLPQECHLVKGSLRLQSSMVKEVMRPREEVLFYDINDPLDQLVHLMSDLATTRVPICEKDLDHLLGIFHTRDFLFHRKEIQGGKDLIPFLKKPTFVPESMRAWALLKSLREKGESLSMVVNEYGSISGLITQEDLVEIVVGEIADLRDGKSNYSRSGDDVIIASGKLELSEFREIFGITLISKENIVTLGGWLIEQLGDIPQVGTKYANDQFLFYVLEAEPNRLRRIYVRKLH